MVLAGLAQVGATTQEAASGLLALCVLQGVGNIWLGWRFKRPLLTAWSTPGAALLTTQAYLDGGWPAAVGAFAITGALIILTGLAGNVPGLVLWLRQGREIL